MIFNIKIFLNFLHYHNNFFTSSLDSTSYFPCSSIAFIYFSEAFTKGEYVNLAWSVTLLWSEGSNSSPVWYSYLSIVPGEGLSDAKVASVTKKQYVFAVHF